MNDVQAAAIARADASTEHGRKLYELRTRLMYLICKMPMRDLERLCDLVGRMSLEDAREVAAYAEGLAEFNAAL